jgi:hypothetical protein
VQAQVCLVPQAACFPLLTSQVDLCLVAQADMWLMGSCPWEEWSGSLMIPGWDSDFLSLITPTFKLVPNLGQESPLLTLFTDKPVWTLYTHHNVQVTVAGGLGDRSSEMTRYSPRATQQSLCGWCPQLLLPTTLWEVTLSLRGL